MQKQPSNFRRDIIIHNNLLDYMNDINVSDRNKDITVKYANGMSFKELSKEYNITVPRVTQIIANCLRKCTHKKE